MTSSNGFKGGLSDISLESPPSIGAFERFGWCLGFGANGSLFCKEQKNRLLQCFKKAVYIFWTTPACIVPCNPHFYKGSLSSLVVTACNIMPYVHALHSNGR